MMQLGLIGYLLAAAGFTLLSLLAGFSWGGKPLGMRFIFAFVATVIWAAGVVGAAFIPQHAFTLVYFPELLRNVALLWAILGIGADVVHGWLKTGVWILGIVAALAGLVWLYAGHIPGVELSADQLLAHAGLSFTFAGVVCLEQTYRNAGATARSSLRYVVLGFGCIFAYDLFLYSQAELFRQLRPDAWLARGFVTGLAAPLLALAVRRNPDCSLDIFVSRQAVSYTAAFLLVGVYLLFVAAGGYYVRNMGGTWGDIAQIFFFSGAIIVLIGTLFSQAVRRRTQVFIAKHFFSNKYDYRVEWLRFVRTLSTQSSLDIRSNAVCAIAQTIGSPGGVLYMHDEERRRFVPRAVWPSSTREQSDYSETDAMRVAVIDDAIAGDRQVAEDEQIAVFLKERKWIIDLVEYRQTPELYQNFVLPTWLEQHRSWRIVVPVLELDRLAGFMVLAETNPPLELTYEDRDLLKTLGSHVATYLAQHDASAKLTESRQFEAYNRLTAFLMHDLKNSVAQLKLIVSNSAKHKTNPAFIDDVIDTVANTADRMTRLIDQLRGAASDAALRRVNLNDVARLAVNRCIDRQPAPTFAKHSDVLWVRADPDRLQTAIEHLIRNAQDATSADGSVAVTASLSADGEPRLAISDSGQGMESKFVRERLFKPFDSTKGSKGMGIGAYQVREYMVSIDGSVEVCSSPGSGSTFTLTFKKYIDPQAVSIDQRGA